MSDVNAVALTGNLTRDPEMRRTQGGMQVLSFSIAVNRRAKDAATGEWGEAPNYVDITMFGNYAEAMGRYLSKGCKVALSGELRWSSWERDGQRRSKLEVIASELVLMQRREQQPAQRPAVAEGCAQADVFATEDCPF